MNFKMILSFLFTLLCAQKLFANQCSFYLNETNKAKETQNSTQQEITQKFNYTPVWKNPEKTYDFDKVKNFNGLLVDITSRFILKNKRLPEAEDLINESAKALDRLKQSSSLLNLVKEEGSFTSYFQKKKAPNSIQNLAFSALLSRPESITDFHERAPKFIAETLNSKLRIPSFLEIAEKLKLEEELVEVIITKPEQYFKEALKEHPELVQRAQNKIVNAYLRALRGTDDADYNKVRAKTPDLDRLLMSLSALAKDKPLGLEIESGFLDIPALRKLLGEGEKETSSYIVLFEGGLKDVEAKAREKSPSAFKNFIPDEIYNERKLANLQEALIKRDGFLVTSVNAGIPIVESQLATMLAYAKDKNFDILIFPTSQILDGIDPRLISNPRVHIITHTVENSYLKLWNIPILAKNQNALASLDGPNQVKPGQTAIVGHAQQALKIKPTGSNHIRSTAIWSTGSLSQANYPYRHAIQGRTSEIAKNNHINGFLVLEKSDAKAGAMEEGAQNFWHVRPVEHMVDRSGDKGVEGFTDINVSYLVRERAREESSKKELPVEKIDMGAEVLVLGDLHDKVTDQAYMSGITSFIHRNPSIKKIVLHDPIDGNSHNRHEAEQTSLLIRKFQSGDLDFHKEMMGIVQVVNALTSVRPDLQVIIADSNHSYWARALIDKQPQSQSVINGLFLAELTYASRMLGVSDPLTYVLQHRNNHLQSLPPEKRIEMESQVIPVSHPERISVLPFGDSFVYGPKDNPVHLNFHGHQGANGAKGSPRAHASGSLNAITGDSHQSMMLGRWLSVGTTTPQRVGYNNGGYSAWTNSFALVYPDGSKQLLIYSAMTQTFRQRKEAGVLKAEDFYGDEPMRIRENDNDVVEGSVVDQHSQFLDAVGAGQRPGKK